MNLKKMNFKLSLVLSFLFLNSIKSDHINYKGLKYIYLTFILT